MPYGVALRLSRTVRARARTLTLAVLLAVTLAACGDDDNVGSTPTATPTGGLGGAEPTLAPTPSPTSSPFPAPTFLTSLAGSVDYWPRWSPDGDTVLFSRQTAGTDDGRYRLYTVPGAGGAASLLPGIPATLGATRAAWSQTGPIAFSGSDAPNTFAIYVIEPDGSNLRALDPPDVGTILNYPSWYPDGQYLAIVDYGSDPSAPAGTIKKIGVPSPSTTPLTDLNAIYAGEPAVSPDGLTLAFPGQPNDGQPYDQANNRIYLLPQPDGTPTPLDAFEGRTPDWSPDGAYLAFESTRGCTGGLYAIFIEARGGGTARQVTDCASNGNHAVWSPDATRIAFSAVLPGATGSRGIAVFEVPPLP